MLRLEGDEEKGRVERVSRKACYTTACKGSWKETVATFHSKGTFNFVFTLDLVQLSGPLTHTENVLVSCYYLHPHRRALVQRKANSLCAVL